MHRTVIGWVINGGRHCRRMKIFQPVPKIAMNLICQKYVTRRVASYPRSNKTEVSVSSISHVFFVVFSITCTLNNQMSIMKNDQEYH